MLPELTQEEYSAALDSVADDALVALSDATPPIDALALAKALRMPVAWDTDQEGRGRIVRLGGFDGGEARTSIFLRPDERRERLQWAVAHEIGESLAEQVFARLHADPREAPAGAREKVANQLAGRLLLPRAMFERDGRQLDWDLPALKHRYPTASHELIARRMLDVGAGLMITIFDHGRRTFRRGTLPGRLPPFDALEQAAWREAHLHGQVAALGDYRMRVRAWPIHEPAWKREILRTEWNASDGCDEW